MQKHTDGSVTLTGKEWDALNKAYQSLYDIVNDQPSNLGDYYYDIIQIYLYVCKWQCLLEGEPFEPTDHVERGSYLWDEVDWDDLEEIGINAEGEQVPSPKIGEEDD